MSNIFNMDNGFFRAMGRLADLMILNLLFIVCSLPIFTIGASVTAMYYVTLKMAGNEEGYVFRSFLKSFKQNFKQATVIWLIVLFVGCILGLDMYILNHSNNSLSTVLFVLISATSLIYTMVVIYVFPLLSRFENKTTTTLRNAFIMAIADFPRTIVMLVIVIGSIMLTFLNAYTFWYGLLVWILGGFAIVAFANSYFLNKIFKKYMPEEEETDELKEILADEDLENAEPERIMENSSENF
ncbi:MAG: DUF624 domain-containing protein [Lachnospiraceae bacterium]|nr:DUF624 domain-containing protein [Lachnospiraceae bacterium]